jgi:hypothetical protein
MMVKKLLLLFILLFLYNLCFAQIHTWVENVKSCPSQNVVVPVKVTNFVDIGSISIRIKFDTSKLIYIGYQNINPLTNLFVNGVQSLGFVAAAVYTLNNYTLPDSATLFEMIFTHNIGDSCLMYFDTITVQGCVYSDPIGNVLPAIYYSGYVYNPIISGYVQYDNALNSPVGNCKVYLMQNGIKLDSTISQVGTGYYSFKCVQPGYYYFNIHKIGNWGGGDVLDALMLARHSVWLLYIDDPLLRKAGDVNNSMSLNSIDCLLICRRYIEMITYFLIDDWLCDDTVFQVSDQIGFTKNVKVVCAGDVNASYIPPSD